MSLGAVDCPGSKGTNTLYENRNPIVGVRSGGHHVRADTTRDAFNATLDPEGGEEGGKEEAHENQEIPKEDRRIDEAGSPARTVAAIAP